MQRWIWVDGNVLQMLRCRLSQNDWSTCFVCSSEKSKCQYVVVSIQQCSLLHGLYLHNNIFLTDFIVFQFFWLKFSYNLYPQNEILVCHWLQYQYQHAKQTRLVP